MENGWGVDGRGWAIITGCGFLREALVAQIVKNLPAMRETHPGLIPGSGRSFGEATHSSILAWRIPWTEETGRLRSVRSVAQSYPTQCYSIDCSMPSLLVHHQLPEFTQTHVHPVGDVIQPSHPLSSPSFPSFNLSQPQGLFQ